MTAPKELQELTYEQAREELLAVVRQLEQGGLTLDSSVSLWERGEALVQRCEAHLDGATQRIRSVLATAEPEKNEKDSPSTQQHPEA